MQDAWGGLRRASIQETAVSWNNSVTSRGADLVRIQAVEHAVRPRWIRWRLPARRPKGIVGLGPVQRSTGEQLCYYRVVSDPQPPTQRTEPREVVELRRLK